MSDRDRKLHILVTGGAGYVGSTLVPQLLAEGHHVRVLDSLRFGGRSLLGVWSQPGFEFVRGDIRNDALVRDCLEDVDAVVHLAAIVGDPACSRAPEEAREVNGEASVALFTACREMQVPRFVFASTCSNYGRMDANGSHVDPDALMDETSALHPLSLYAETKVGFELEMLDPIRSGPLCATALRFATIFGVSPRMRFDLTVNEFTAEMITRHHLVVYGEQFWRPYVHVRDAAMAIRLVLDAPVARVRGQVFNVGSSAQNFRKQDIVKLIQRRVPDATIEYVHVAQDPRNYRVSFAKIHDRLSYRTTTSVEEGVDEVARLVRQGVLTDTADAAYRN
jgi:nucleoside-diphosphate-sugar epimerase